MKLVPLTLETAQRARVWRLSCPEALRTTMQITESEQSEWFERISRDPCERWWGIEERFLAKDYHNVDRVTDIVVGYCGIEHINWAARNGEISLLIDPVYQGKGYGREAVTAILDEAAYTLGLRDVYGECYLCGPVQFWDDVVTRYRGYYTLLPNRKYWDGEHWDSYYFSIPVWRMT